MSNYKQAFLNRFNLTEVIGGREVEYFATVGNTDLVILREGDAVGYVLGENLELSEYTPFNVYQPFGLLLKLSEQGVVEVYPNLMLTLQRLMATLPSAVETLIDKGREMVETPEAFYEWITNEPTEHLIESSNFFLALYNKTSGLPNVEPNLEKGMEVLNAEILEKLLTETKAMTEPMFDSWLQIQSDSDLETLCGIGELGFVIADELTEREMENLV